MPTPTKRFVPPTQDEWCAYAIAEYQMDRDDALSAWFHYEANGWYVGKVKMKKWRAAVATCAHMQHRRKVNGSNYARDLAAQKELEEVKKRMASIRNSYEAHQSWAQDDRERWNKLIARKKELMGRLGL